MAKILDFVINGAINVFETTEKHLVIAVRYKKKGEVVQDVVPVIHNLYYSDDPEISEIVENFCKEDFLKDKRLDLKRGFSESKTPDFQRIIERYLPVKGGVKNKHITNLLIEKGYNVLPTSNKFELAPIRDYSKLAEDPLAKKIMAENRAELLKNKATFESLNDELKIIFEYFQRDLPGMILTGPAGTGKSWVGRIFADKMNAPYLTIQLNRGTQVEDLQGKWIPAEEGEKNWEFIRGLLLKAYVEGWIIVIEEVNLAEAGVLALLNQFLDGTLRICIENKLYERHPNFTVIMTMNPGYEGTLELNTSLKDRFAMVVMPGLTEGQYTERMYNYCEKILSKEFFKKLFDFSNKIEKIGHNNIFHENVVYSIRSAKDFVKSMLARRFNEKEFTAGIHPFFINKLNCDNDNAEEVEKLKEDSGVIADIKELYELYSKADLGDYRETEEDFEFEEFDEEPEETITKEKVDEDDDLIEDDLATMF